MPHRKAAYLLAIAAFGAALSAPLAVAHAQQDTMMKAKASVQPFTLAALKAAQSAGKTILVHAHAGWCPTCRAQVPVIDAIAADPANAGVVIFRLDFDQQKAERRALNITGQSTIIAYRGMTETGRVQGETKQAAIAKLVSAARS